MVLSSLGFGKSDNSKQLDKSTNLKLLLGKNSLIYHYMASISRKILPIAVILILVNILSVTGAGTLGKNLPAQVVKVVDGDTIRVMTNGHEEKVRLDRD